MVANLYEKVSVFCTPHIFIVHISIYILDHNVLYRVLRLYILHFTTTNRYITIGNININLYLLTTKKSKLTMIIFLFWRAKNASWRTMYIGGLIGAYKLYNKRCWKDIRCKKLIIALFVTHTWWNFWRALLTYYFWIYVYLLT